MTSRPPAGGRRSRRPRLLTLGDLVLDIVARTQEGVAAGTDVAGTIELRAGGSAANTARAFVALGGEAAFVGAIGPDGIGRRLVRALRADGVRVHPASARQPTARLAALVDPRGERSFVTQRGAADMLRPRDLPTSAVARADALHLPGYSLINEPLRLTAVRAAEHAHRAGRLVSVDLASHRPLLARGRSAARQMLSEVRPHVVFANVDEARALTGAQPRRLLELGPIAVIKEGAAGCRVLWLAETGGAVRDAAAGGILEVAVATAPIRASDTTGAGDAFDAGFLHSLVEQLLAGSGTASVRADPHDPTAPLRRAAVLRRAAMVGHRAAAQVLSRPRKELAL
ncbi:MAG TPA: PfkB family carbohydrate kinase [Candidatus Limnocylindrales bacterium]|nr:PfkB family carbohydrate kinase [Candidatus Limnocylindrales bacterium]